MTLLSTIKNMFSTASNKPTTIEQASIEHNGFTIIAKPISEGRQYRVAATITKGEGKSHSFIRSDVIASYDECVDVTIRKAKMTIDQSGESIFN